MVKKDFFKVEASRGIYESKYKFETDVDIYDTFDRVSKTLFKDDPKSRELMMSMLSDNRFIFAGRILSNMGTGTTSTSTINCTVMSQIPDSMDGIMDVLKESARTLRRGSGVGYDFSSIRPKGAMVYGLLAQTSGPISMMKIFDTMCQTIESAGGRRGAQMGVMDIQHPDIIDFILSKSVRKTFNNFNLSVNVTDSFMEALENDDDFDLWFWEKSEDYGYDDDVLLADIIEKDELPYDKKHRDYTFFKFSKDHVECVYGNTTPDTIFVKKIYKTMKARELWDMIMKNTYEYAEPGVLFMDVSNRCNIINDIENMRATNPCVTGDTKVAVADGRGSVTIKELADEGKDVLVYAYDNDTGENVVKMMRNPRLTGYNEKIYKITFDDGNYIKVTGNHEIRMSDGRYVRADEMKYGDSVFIATRFKKAINDLDVSVDEDGYVRIESFGNEPTLEYILIYEYYNGKIPKGMIIHHKDGDKQNNDIENLELLTKHEYTKLHGEDMKGDKNPTHAVLADKERREKYIENMSKSVSDLKNGRSKRYSNEELLKITSMLAAKLGRMFTITEFRKFAKEHGLPYTMNTKFRMERFPTFSDFSKECAMLAGVYKDGDELLDMKTLKNKYIAEENGYTTKIVKGTRYPELHVERTCEVCSNKFWVNYNKRERAFCSVSCSNKYNVTKDSWRNSVKEGILARADKIKSETKIKQINVYNDIKLELGRTPMRKEWEIACKERNIPFRVGKSSPFLNFTELKKEADGFNHRVISIEIIGEENVYNGTVDDVHNFNIVLGEKLGENTESLVNSMNCGEQNLPFGGSCLLGSVNLTKYVKTPFSSKSTFDYDKLSNDVMLINEALDNVVEHHGLEVEIQIKELFEKRRHGLGITGLGSTLAMLGYNYGGEESLKFMDKVMSTMLETSLVSNINLARDKGKAPLFKNYPILNIFDDDKMSGYTEVYRDLLLKYKDDIVKHGLRFTHMLSIAPTGSISFMSNNVSSGIEPIFMLEYNRKIVDDSVAGGKRVETIKDYSIVVLDELLESGTISKDEYVSIKNSISTTENIKPIDHLRMQAVAQKYVDSSISKTINVPQSISFDDFKDVYAKGYYMGLKGMTTYRPNPEKLDSVLSSTNNTVKYKFFTENGDVVILGENDKVMYGGKEYVASVLFHNFKDGDLD